MSAALKATNNNINLKGKVTEEFTPAAYYGDANIVRIKANSDSLGQR